jgi:phage tail protein X
MVYVFSNGTAHYTYDVNGTKTPMYDITELGYQLYLNDADSVSTSLTAYQGYSKVDTTGWHVYAVPVEGTAVKGNVKIGNAGLADAEPVHLTAKGAPDVNASSRVTIEDIAAILTSRNLETNSKYLSDYVGTLFRADVNRDGTVDAAADVNIVQDNLE